MQADQIAVAKRTLPWRIPGSLILRNFGLNPAARGIYKLLRHIAHGTLTIRLPDRSTRIFEGNASKHPKAEVIIHDPSVFRRVITGGDIGFAQCYIEGKWETPNLPALMELAQLNESQWQNFLLGGSVRQLLNRAYHKLRTNSRLGSRRNIAFHYDLGNDFYAAWLDQSMTYSSALFRRENQSLSEAQREKYQRIADLAELQQIHQVLEIGCGWGGFMAHAAEQIGCHIRGITLSREQLAYTQQRMQQNNHHHLAEATFTDYRELDGNYDAIVSIEMLEAVGEAHWPRYFQTLHDRLKPGAAAVVQVITIDDKRFESYRRGTDFIQRCVFPGGMLPSPSMLRYQATKAGLILDHEENFGSSYARTLTEWRNNFSAHWPQIARQGFDERFQRFWEYYLCYCETGFKTEAIDVGIFRFRKPL